MCDCRKKLIELNEKHKWCNKRVRFETIIFDKPVETMLEIISCKIPDITLQEEIIVPPVVEIIVPPAVEIIVPPTLLEEEEIELPTIEQEEEYCEEDNTIELTDISPEELIEQEEEEKRIKDELALIQLTKLTKKRVRTKK